MGEDKVAIRLVEIEDVLKTIYAPELLRGTVTLTTATGSSGVTYKVYEVMSSASTRVELPLFDNLAPPASLLSPDDLVEFID